MDKNLDPWKKIANLIEKDKEKALVNFHNREFSPALASKIRRAEHPPWREVRHPAFLAAAASLLLAIGLVSFWLLRGSWQKVPATPVLDNMLSNSFLYSCGNEPKKEASATRVVSSFFKVLSARGAAPGLTCTNVSTAESANQPASVEYGNPEKVRQKIGKVIRESSIERMLTQFCQICKEV